jgi:hypothetical protein
LLILAVELRLAQFSFESLYRRRHNQPPLPRERIPGIILQYVARIEMERLIWLRVE